MGPSVHPERTFLEGFIQKNPIPKGKPHRKVLHCQLEPASRKRQAAHMQNGIVTGSLDGWPPHVASEEPAASAEPFPELEPGSGSNPAAGVDPPVGWDMDA